MANIHKEISQLEHWLLNLPNDVEESSSKESSSKKDSNTVQPVVDLARLYEGIERMSQQLNFQQITLAHITDRIEILENFREVPVQQQDEMSPWLTDAINLDEEEDEVPIIHVIHMDESDQKQDLPSSDPKSSPVQVMEEMPKNEIIHPPASVDPVKEDLPIEPVNVSQKMDEPVKSDLPVEAQENKVQELVVQKDEVATQDEVEEEEVQEQPQVEEVQKEEPVQEEEAQEEVQEAEEESQEEAEEEMEGTVFEYKDTTYYRDLDNHVFAVDENGELSDMAIGFWKEKTQTILFYKMK